ncbi:MAG TPA: histidine kinase dimerization/phosphoacceptor domain-containing protein, partial [Solirubrobacteraceae bacterium]|nr:histidine kinase dimerization/phosphoacceptor domain-containing protein [Solirubrobacteraceae bacterium]
MGAARLIAVRAPGTRRWGELTSAERVGLYTRQSLYFVLLSFNTGLLLSAAVELDGGGGELALLAGGGAVVTALGFAVMHALLRRYPEPRPLPWALIAALLVAVAAFSVAGVAAFEGPARGTVVSVAVASIVLPLGLLPDPRLSAALVAGSGALVGVSGGALVNLGAGLLLGAALLFTARASMWMYGIVTELDAARSAQAQLAVVEERLRFSRDVHDVLGRRLSTIAVQAELAATLAGRGDERAAERMLEVRAV